jgi:formylglycine-generating enzyme required for sulfatase activity
MNREEMMEDPLWQDPQSGLMWQVEPTGGRMTWSEAKAHCEKLSLGGFDDWRLPTVSELCRLIRSVPTHHTKAFWPSELSGRADTYWSSSAVADREDYAWGVYFDTGYVDSPDDTDSTILARCVRP